MEIVEDFVEKSYTNNGKSWRSLRILRLKPKTSEIFRDFAFEIFFIFSSFSSDFFMFQQFFWFSSFFSCFRFSFFPFFIVSIFFLSFIFSFLHFHSFLCVFFFFFLLFCFFHFSFFSSSFSFFSSRPSRRKPAKNRPEVRIVKKDDFLLKIRLLGLVGQGRSAVAH